VLQAPQAQVLLEPKARQVLLVFKAQPVFKELLVLLVKVLQVLLASVLVVVLVLPVLQDHKD
jgi:hypothetical protein